ncbi:SH3 domain-containing protein 19 isoform X2 [Heteronotia binoei]|uniref:SH3 domain-containing protein 19 isoform X2 n=1 Tax=Heteronotia binoei TaxID=13085 RepID=UPI00292D7E36|nr:SH3 domain-containing protein 19 isoform X2 [Heteronotia binoei]
MAEAWRLEDDEEELKELGRRHRRTNLNPANDRTERNKPDHRSSGQGPLSSIKAAIKRTSRTSGHSEQQRERRRPEITIVAAEPLRPSSWFPGGNHVSQQGLVFPSSPTPGSWRTNELVLAEPPSYEQVIKEISQVGTTSQNNAVGTANSRCTATSSTQTDFPEEIISSSPGINVKSNLHALCECETAPAVQIPRKPPRPLSSLLNNNPSKNENLLVVLEEQTCQEKPNADICPVPKPRSKGNLKPVVKETQNNTEDNQEETSQSRDSSSIQLVSLLDDSLLDSHVVIDSMDTDKSQSSIVSRIKGFETQANTETSGLAKKPEISPHSLASKPVVNVKKPVVAPKPGVTRTSDECDSWTENKFKVVSQERHLQPQEAGSSITTKPELPKKPKPDTVKSSSSGPLNTDDRLTSDNTEGQKKSPIPAPRPLVPKKSVSFESPAVPLLPLQPSASAPKLSVAVQSNAFRSLGEPTASSLSAAPQQGAPSREGDLISFDDDVLPINSVGAVQDLTHSESDLVNLPSKNEPVKEQLSQPAVVRKPTVIRIPSKAAKALNEVSGSPPPLPVEKPIGNTCSISTGKPNNIKTSKKESECSGLTQLSKNEPTMPPRPAEGKNVPARPPPPKGAPGRPPPPKCTKTSSQMDNFCRSSSDTTLNKKHSMFGLEVKRTKSQINKNQDPALPPRPKPGHPLYNKYMLPVPHGIAKEDISPQNTGGLSCKRGDVLVLVDHIDSKSIECQRGEETGKVRLSQVQIVTPIDESSRNKEKDSDNTQKFSDTSVPHAVVLHDFLAEHPDDLGLSSGETVYLLKKLDDDWYRGKCKNHTGIFPASFVKIIVDIPGESNRRKVPFLSPSVTGPRCVARFEYIGDKNDELSFSEGEIIILKKYVNEEWAKGELRGASGIFPLNFVEVLEDLPVPDGGASLKNKNGNCASVTQLEQHSGEWCDALHDFTAETNEDLAFKRGDHILILEHVDSEWYRGRLNGKEGIFPAIFVHICSGPKPAPWKRRGQALYDFQAQNEDELSFKAGDVIMELESEEEDWMSGELHGKSGIFPKSFVQILQ